MIDESFITVEGTTSTQIKKAIHQWINLYAESLPSNFSIKLYKGGSTIYILIPDQRLENERFNFLVNYLNYPDNIEIKLQVHGYTVISDTKIYPKEKLHYEIEVFIPENDKDYDNVFAVTQYNDVFKVDFRGKTTKVTVKKEFKKPDFDLDKLEIIETIKLERPNSEKLTEFQNNNILKRTRFISFAILLLFLLSYIKVGDSKTFLLINAVIGYGIWIWFSWDYKMLQKTNFYLNSLLISIIVLLYGIFLGHKFVSGYIGFAKAGLTLPVFFLILQLPTRLIFRAIMKREPVVDKPAPSFADFVYIFFLFMTSLLIPTLILIK
jgi:hypothetical protein